jgi:urocanate hydratase
LWGQLRRKRILGVRFRRQFQLGRYFVDFVCLPARLVVEVDGSRAGRRLEAGYVDEQTDDLDEAIALVDRWRTERVGRSVALVGNAADVLPELVRRGWTPDVLTD